MIGGCCFSPGYAFRVGAIGLVVVLGFDLHVGATI